MTRDISHERHSLHPDVSHVLPRMQEIAAELIATVLDAA